MNEPGHRRFLQGILGQVSEIRSFCPGSLDDFIVQKLDDAQQLIKKRLSRPQLGLGQEEQGELHELEGVQSRIIAWRREKKGSILLPTFNKDQVTPLVSAVRAVFWRYWYEALADEIKRFPLGEWEPYLQEFLSQIAQFLGLPMPKPLMVNPCKAWIANPSRDWRKPGTWERSAIEYNDQLNEREKELLLAVHDHVRLLQQPMLKLDELMLGLQEPHRLLNKLGEREALAYFDQELYQTNFTTTYASELPNWLKGYPRFYNKLARAIWAHKRKYEQDFVSAVEQMRRERFPWLRLNELIVQARWLEKQEILNRLERIEATQMQVLHSQQPACSQVLELATELTQLLPNPDQGTDLAVFHLLLKKFQLPQPPKWENFSRKIAPGKQLLSLLKRHYDYWLDQFLQMRLLQAPSLFQLNGPHPFPRSIQVILSTEQIELELLEECFSDLSDMPYERFTHDLHLHLRRKLVGFQRQMLFTSGPEFVQLWDKLPKCLENAELTSNLHFKKALLELRDRPADFRKWLPQLMAHMPKDWNPLNWLKDFDRSHHIALMQWLANHPAFVEPRPTEMQQLLEIFIHVHLLRPTVHAPMLVTLMSNLFRSKSQSIKVAYPLLCRTEDARILFEIVESLQAQQDQRLNLALEECLQPQRQYLGKALLRFTWNEQRFDQELLSRLSQSEEFELFRQVLCYFKVVEHSFEFQLLPVKFLEIANKRLEQVSQFIRLIWIPWSLSSAMQPAEKATDRMEEFVEVENLLNSYLALKLDKKDILLVEILDSEVGNELGFFLIEWQNLEKNCPSFIPLLSYVGLENMNSGYDIFDKFIHESSVALKKYPKSKLLSDLRKRVGILLERMMR